MKQFNLINIPRQAKYWDLFSRIVPIIFVIVASVYYFNQYTTIGILVWTGIILFGVTSLVWWWWTLFTIIKLFSVLNEAHEKFHSISNEISTLKEHIENATDTTGRQRRKSTKN
jgi:hypothetical protein